MNGLESSNVAAPGDWIVTNLSPDKLAMRNDCTDCNPSG